MSTKIHCDVCGQCLFDSTKDMFATCPHYPGYSIPQPLDETISLDVTTVKDIRNLLGFVADRDIQSIAALQNRFEDYVDKLNGLVAERIYKFCVPKQPERSEFGKAWESHLEAIIDGNKTTLGMRCNECFMAGWQACREKFLAKGLELNGEKYPTVKQEYIDIAAELDAEKKK